MAQQWQTLNTCPQSTPRSCFESLHVRSSQLASLRAAPRTEAAARGGRGSERGELQRVRRLAALYDAVHWKPAHATPIRGCVVAPQFLPFPCVRSTGSEYEGYSHPIWGALIVSCRRPSAFDLCFVRPVRRSGGVRRVRQACPTLHSVRAARGQHAQFIGVELQ